MNTKISTILITFFLIFSNPNHAQSQDAQTILVCPQEVICEGNTNDSCHLSDNPYGMWSKPSNGIDLHKGTYKLKEVLPFIMKKPRCIYSNNTEKYPISVGCSGGESNEENLFKPLITNSSKWVGNNLKSMKCQSSDPLLCPLVEEAEITMDRKTSYSFSSYTPDGLFYNRIDETNLGNNISYEKLIKICGVTSNCIIDIGNCNYNSDYHDYRCDHLGTVDLDLSEIDIVKINHLETDWWVKNTCSFKKRAFFNTIYCSK